MKIKKKLAKHKRWADFYRDLWFEKYILPKEEKAAKKAEQK